VNGSSHRGRRTPEESKLSEVFSCPRRSLRKCSLQKCWGTNYPSQLERSSEVVCISLNWTLIERKPSPFVEVRQSMQDSPGYCGSRSWSTQKAVDVCNLTWLCGSLPRDEVLHGETSCSEGLWWVLERQGTGGIVTNEMIRCS
jgi:hypothetical protein